MNKKSPNKIIQDLGDGLIMRSAAREDADALAEFCSQVFMHEESGTEAWWIAEWIRDLISKPHPTLNIDDVIIVEDVNKQCLASTTTYLHQTWSYDGIEFQVGHPEIVGTASEYRNRGLIRKQFDTMHAWAAQRGHDVQVVLGIPSYYRQFGYEYALPAETNLHAPITSFPRWGNEKRNFRLRETTIDDVPFITRVLNASSDRSMVSPVFREDEVKYMTFDRHERSAVCHKTAILCKSDGDNFGEPIGVLMYAMTIAIDLGVMLRVEMTEPRYWREAVPALLKEFVELADKATKDANDPDREIKTVRQDMQPDHPIYLFDEDALGNPPDRQYAWYVRVSDIPRFLSKITPALERRIANSIHAAFTGSLKIQLERKGVILKFEKGKIVEIENIPSMHWEEANARFPANTFLPVLFGMRSIDEALDAHPDAKAAPKSDRHLLETMFPKRSSDLSLTLT